MLAGRGDEVAQLVAALRSPGLAVLRGAPGVGKTAVARAALAVLALEGAMSCAAAGVHALRHRSGLTMAQALRVPLPDRLDGAAAVARVATRGKLLLLDDAHDADLHSVRIAVGLAADRPVLLVVDDAVRNSATELIEASAGVVIDLGPLPVAAAASMARARDSSIADDVLRAVLRSARGNPAAIEVLLSTGEVNVRRALAVRMARLSPAARTAMVALGLLGRPASTALLGPACEELSGTGLVHLSRGTVSFGSAVLYKVAGSLCTPADAAAIHLALAARVRDPLERVRHLGAAGDRAGAVRVARDALVVTAEPRVRAELCATVAAGDAAGAQRWWLEAAAEWRRAGEEPLAAAAERRAVRQDLTARERDVLGLLVEGLSTPAIAARLGIAAGTVEDHVAAVLRKSGARNRTEAVVLSESP